MKVGFLSLVVVVGCEQSLPGDPVGSYSVSATLEENTCGGAAVGAIESFSFGVQIRRRDREAFWIRDDAPMVSGTYDGDDAYRFTFDLSRELVPADLDFGVAGCTVAQHEVVSVIALSDTESGEADNEQAGMQPLSGEHKVDLAPHLGSDCTVVLAVGGGPFAALPCRVLYTLEGEAESE